jgi:hypothetical protein
VCPVGTTSFVDRRLADVAIDLLRSPPPSRARIVDERALAVEILVATTAPIDFQPILVDLAARGDDESLARILRSKPPTSDLLEHATIVALWQREKVRAEVAEALARGSIDTWSARAWACERVAERDGLDVDGLLEAWALAMLEKGSSHVADIETIDQLRSVVRVVVDRAPPAQAISFYQQLHDELSASFFVKAVRRAPRDRAAALREAAAKMGTGGSRAARKAWLEATRSVSSTPAQPRASQSA